MNRRPLVALAFLFVSLSAMSAQAPDVPHGTVTSTPGRARSSPAPMRDYWVYVPAQYDAAKPAARDGVSGRRRLRQATTGTGACPSSSTT